MSTELENEFVAKSLPELYLKSDFADIYFAFIIAKGTIALVPAHKIILSVNSPVFKKKFFGPLKDVFVNVDKTVKMKIPHVVISDADLDTFKEFLQFFYLPKVTITAKNQEAVIQLIDKYGMLDFLNRNVEDLVNFWGQLSATRMNNDKLKEFCQGEIQFFAKQSRTFFTSDIFLKCDREVVKHILQLKALYCTEVELFEACIAWAKASCKSNGLDGNDPNNLKKQLGECFYLIRFGAMTVLDLHKIYELYSGLFSLFSVRSVDNWESKTFRITPRSPLDYIWDSDNVLTCIRGSFDANHFNKSVIRCRESSWFTTNAPLLLGGISCPSVYNNRCKVIHMNFTVNIIEYQKQTFEISGANKVIFTGTIQIVSGSGNGGSVSMTAPLLINPRKLYEVRFETTQISKDIDFFHHWTWNSEVKLDETLEVKFHNSPSHSKNQSGLIKGLIFNRTKTISELVNDEIQSNLKLITLNHPDGVPFDYTLCEENQEMMQMGRIPRTDFPSLRGLSYLFIFLSSCLGNIYDHDFEL